MGCLDLPPPPKKTLKNSPGFCPAACQITNIEFWYQPFPFFRIVFETFAIEANSSSHFRAIFRFPIAINSNLDTNSSHNSSSSRNRTRIRARAIVSVREVRARGGGLYSRIIRGGVSRSHRTRGCGLIFKGGGLLFWSDFRKGFFLKNGAKWTPKWPQKSYKI